MCALGFSAKFSMEAVARLCEIFCHVAWMSPDNPAILDVFSDWTGAHQGANWQSGF